eukprot:scaffold10578_cov158-Skeletonema_menzelii.AAC.17
MHKQPRHHQCNESILEYDMKCLDDQSDSLVQNINYGRFKEGTQLVDGTCAYGGRFIVRSEESVESLVEPKAVIGVFMINIKIQQLSVQW